MNDYTQLRTLLLDEEQLRLNRLEKRLDDPEQRSQEIGAILPSVVRAATRNQGELSAALQSPVDSCVKQSVQQDPQTFVKAILPVMGPIVRKNIAEAFKSIREFLQGQQVLLEKLDKRIVQVEVSKLQELQTQLREVNQVLARFERIEADLNNSDAFSQKIATILPAAIRQASLKSAEMEDDFQEAELTASLRKPVEQCIKESISQDTKVFANALFPVMGPAIRKSINESFKSIVQSINTGVEQSLSIRGMKWRIQALRTGRPFAEIVLQNTLVYRVEQVFLIHRDTGLLLQHVYQEEIEVGDSEAVSAMFTAIQDFIRDSFSASKSAELESVEVGDYTVWVERGPNAVLACVVRGVAPYDFRFTMRSVLESIHARYGRFLEHFNGDNTPLETSGPLLQRALQSKLKPDEGKGIFFSFRSVGILILLTLCLLIWGYKHFSYHYRLDTYLNTLRHTPGIVLVEKTAESGYTVIRGLRDPLAEDPQQIANRFDLSEQEVKGLWTPYQDLTPHFIEQRLKFWLKPPESVRLSVKGTTLYLSGQAEQSWIEKVLSSNVGAFGISSVDAANLTNDERLLEQQVREWVKPPSTVTLFLKKGTVYLSGHAPTEWIEKAKGVTTAVAGIQQLNHDKLVETDKFLLQLARQELIPPATVELSVKLGVLKVSGFADSADYQQLQHRCKRLQGFNQINTSELVDEGKRQTVMKSIEKTVIHFSDNADFADGQEMILERLLAQWQEISLMSVKRPVFLQITGYTDGLGSKNHNQTLSQLRGNAVKNWLQSKGIAPEMLEVTLPPVVRFNEKQPNLDDRKVGFQVLQQKG